MPTVDLKIVEGASRGLMGGHGGGGGAGKQGHRAGIVTGVVLDAAEALLLTDADGVAGRVSQCDDKVNIQFCFCYLLLIGQMVVVGGDEVEGAEAARDTLVVLEAPLGAKK